MLVEDMDNVDVSDERTDAFLLACCLRDPAIGERDIGENRNGL